MTLSYWGGGGSAWFCDSKSVMGYELSDKPFELRIELGGWRDFFIKQGIREIIEIKNSANGTPKIKPKLKPKILLLGSDSCNNGGDDDDKGGDVYVDFWMIFNVCEWFDLIDISDGVFELLFGYNNPSQAFTIFLVSLLQQIF